MIPLPIDSLIDPIRASLQEVRAAVISAPPGAGKTTRLPPALLDAGPVILLQPRRVAARSVAHRIALERGWTLGREIGWQVRFDRRYSSSTGLLVVTEGILTARLQADPLLSGFHTIVVDEFHERSIHADLALALSKQAWRARDDLRIVVMSATLDIEPVCRFLDGCPRFSVSGRTYPLDVSYAPDERPADAAVRVALLSDGDVLCFMPGAAEIRRTIAEILPRIRGLPIEVMPLHGSLEADEQDRALAGPVAGSTRIIVSTNIAETSLTVPGVRHVVDSGLQKVARYDVARGIDSLNTERTTQDAADQRAGRAGRIASGRVVRLWDSRDRLRPHREADIHRIDLSATLLDVLAWGGRPEEFEWFDPPRPEALGAALDLLFRLGAVEDGRLTRRGEQMQRLPLPPRLARMLIEAQGAWPVVQGCALLSERQYLPPRTHATTSDLLSAIDSWSSTPPHVQQVAHEIERTTRNLFNQPSNRQPIDERDFRRAVLAGYPDRLARRREPGSDRVKLSSGAGAVLGPESGVIEGDFLVALDIRAPSRHRTTAGVQAAGHDQGGLGVIRIASRVEADWLQPNQRRDRCWFDERTGVVRAATVECYDALVLSETPAEPDQETASRMLADAWLRRGPTEPEAKLLLRLRFAGRDPDVAALVKIAAAGQRSLARVSLIRALDPALVRGLDLDAPETLIVPSGRAVALQYGEDGGVQAAVKLQELFGLADSPRIGPRREPVLFALLAPNGRPVQMTRDLRSFWERTYPEVRRELRGRYPKHPWPDDPWNAVPTARTNRRSS